MKTTNLKIKLSDWAEWVAQDQDGEWWELECKPELSKDCDEFIWIFSAGRHSHIITGQPNPNWRETLRKV